LGTDSILLSGDSPIAQAINLALHIRRKILIELVAYRERQDLSRKALEALEDGFVLGGYLGMPRQIAHDKLWQAILLARSDKMEDRVARRCLDEAQSTGCTLLAGFEPFVGACVWCGHGYGQFSLDIQAAHLKDCVEYQRAKAALAQSGS
jgi:hypothetical protein